MDTLRQSPTSWVRTLSAPGLSDKNGDKEIWNWGANHLNDFWKGFFYSISKLVTCCLSHRYEANLKSRGMAQKREDHRVGCYVLKQLMDLNKPSYAGEIYRVATQVEGKTEMMLFQELPGGEATKIYWEDHPEEFDILPKGLVQVHQELQALPKCEDYFVDRLIMRDLSSMSESLASPGQGGVVSQQPSTPSGASPNWSAVSLTSPSPSSATNHHSIRSPFTTSTSNGYELIDQVWASPLKQTSTPSDSTTLSTTSSPSPTPQRMYFGAYSRPSNSPTYARSPLDRSLTQSPYPGGPKTSHRQKESLAMVRKFNLDDKTEVGEGEDNSSNKSQKTEPEEEVFYPNFMSTADGLELYFQTH